MDLVAISMQNRVTGWRAKALEQGWSGRVLLMLSLVGLLLLLVVPAAHALGGGGIGGFGDSGGGGVSGAGGGHFVGGGGGVGSEEGSTGLSVIARLVILGVIVLYGVIGALRVRGLRKRVEQRESLSLGFAQRTLRRAWRCGRLTCWSSGGGWVAVCDG